MTTSTTHPGAVTPKPKDLNGAGRGETKSLISLDSEIFDHVEVALEAKLGESRMTVSELLALGTGSVVKLGLKLNELVELRLNGVLVARGEIVAVGDNFGVKLVEVAKAP